MQYMLTLHRVIFCLAQGQSECPSGSLGQFQISTPAMSLIEEDQTVSEVVCKGCRDQGHLLAF